MKLQFKYAGSSGIASDLGHSRVAFATNVLREPSFLEGDLARPLVVREGLAALHAVVVRIIVVSAQKTIFQLSSFLVSIVCDIIPIATRTSL